MLKQNNINPPYIKLRDSVVTVMTDVIIALIPLYVMAFFYYGARAIALGLVSALYCYALDRFCFYLRRKSFGLFDLSSVVTGLIVPLLCPVSIPFGIVIAADTFGILAAKVSFGGTANNIFNPAAAAVCFATISYSSKMSLFPVPFDLAETLKSPSEILRLGGIPTTELSDMLFGNFPGPMGAVNILVIISCFIYLIMRKVIRPDATLALILTAFVLGGLFPRADVGFLRSGILEIFSGSLFFGAVYLINDPSTSPKRRLGKLIFGFVVGCLTILFRHVGAFEQEICFVILVCNSFCGIIDYAMELIYARKRERQRSITLEEAESNYEK